MIHRIISLAAISLLSVLALQGATGEDSPDGDCPNTTWMDGIGMVCRTASGLLRTFDADGQPIGFTHGPDPIPDEITFPTSHLAAPVPDEMILDSPYCVFDEAEPHVEAFYARAHDAPDNSEARMAVVENLIAQSNTLLHESAQATGTPANIRLLCDATGVIIHNVALPTDAAAANFGTIVRDLKGLGFDNNHVKHWIFYDDKGACWCGGIGHLYGDDRPIADNYNNANPNSAPLYSVTFGYDSARIMLHELGHNMGAVQRSAPNTSGAGHCNDGRDIMCYRDGGPRSHLYTNGACAVQVWDCNNDDYFHTNPEPGSYLDTHWNIGARYNKFVEFVEVPDLGQLPAPIPTL